MPKQKVQESVEKVCRKFDYCSYNYISVVQVRYSIVQSKALPENSFFSTFYKLSQTFPFGYCRVFTPSLISLLKVLLTVKFPTLVLLPKFLTVQVRQLLVLHLQVPTTTYLLLQFLTVSVLLPKLLHPKDFHPQVLQLLVPHLQVRTTTDQTPFVPTTTLLRLYLLGNQFLQHPIYDFYVRNQIHVRNQINVCDHVRNQILSCKNQILLMILCQYVRVFSQ